MARKLIVESPNYDLITEADKNKNLFIIGKFTTADVKNANQRIY
jgi:hypothetical protein